MNESTIKDRLISSRSLSIVHGSDSAHFGITRLGTLAEYTSADKSVASTYLHAFLRKRLLHCLSF